MIRDIKTLRNEISMIDKEILILLSKRMKLAWEVAEYKKANNLPIFDASREKEIIESYSKEVNFNISGIYNAIMEESKIFQKEVIWN